MTCTPPQSGGWKYWFKEPEPEISEVERLREALAGLLKALDDQCGALWIDDPALKAAREALMRNK